MVLYFCVGVYPLTIWSVRRSPGDIERIGGQRSDQWCRDIFRGALFSLSLAWWT